MFLDFLFLKLLLRYVLFIFLGRSDYLNVVILSFIFFCTQDCYFLYYFSISYFAILNLKCEMILKQVDFLLLQFKLKTSFQNTNYLFADFKD